jgi:hypothetical protein
LSRELIGAIGQSKLAERSVDPRRNVVHPVHSRNEVQILANGEILPQRKSLRHVTDVALDLPRFAQDVVAEASPLAARGHQQSAQHPDRRRFAAAVGSEKAEDLAAAHRQREILDDMVRRRNFC